ncbi:MAG TPA: hypothetical protein VG406_00360 [Isosphaeraceae bacterium]|jgi:hypothetical protein|nr:hypothetical protein [Isosphaeraceae bacterium]
MEGDDPRWVGRVTWGFVVLGVALRAFRFAQNYPLWGDEAFLAVNFIDRSYRDAFRHLEYGQVCPLFFLWAEQAAVDLLGFREWTLRLFPLLCGIGSVLLFRSVAATVTRGRALVLAVGIFAASVHPIRHAAEVKPYATDAFIALALLWPALGWLRDRRGSGRLWLLTALTPIALGFSHPAAFVAGGIVLGLAWPAWRSGRWSVRLAFGAFVLATGASFLVLYALTTESQAAVLPGLRAYWSASFPPRDDPVRLLRWLAWVHTGTMFAYPGGGQNGASTATSLACAVGAVVLYRKGRRSAAAVALSPFAMALVAAAWRRYPYGGEARQMQFVAPSICLLAGIGLAAALEAIPTVRPRRLATVAAIALLVVAGLAPVRDDLRHPYRFAYDRRAREFARRFWPEQSRDADWICLYRDLDLREPGCLHLRTATYLCNQVIYSPRGRDRPGPWWTRIDDRHPLRAILYHETRPDNPRVVAWLAAMRAGFALRDTRRVVVPVAGPGEPPKYENIIIFEFVPKARPPAPGRPAERSDRPVDMARVLP